jgi:hypothetical protein
MLSKGTEPNFSARAPVAWQDRDKAAENPFPRRLKDMTFAVDDDPAVIAERVRETMEE